MDGNILVEQLKIWIETWRACHPEVPEGILQGSDLYMFVDGLQNEIKTQIEDFGFKLQLTFIYSPSFQYILLW